MEYSMGGSNNGSGNPLGGSSSDAVPTGMLSSTVTLASQLPMAAGTITIIGILIGCCCALTISSFGRSKGRTPGSGATFPGQSNSRGSTAAKLTVCLGGGLLLWLLGGSLTLMLHWCSSSNFDPRPAIPLAASAQPPKGTFGASNFRGADGIQSSHKASPIDLQESAASLAHLPPQKAASSVAAKPFESFVNSPSSVLARFRHCFPHQSCPGFVSHAPFPRFPRSSYVLNRDMTTTTARPTMAQPKLSPEDLERFEEAVRHAEKATSNTGYFLKGDRRADPTFTWSPKSVADECIRRASSDTVDKQLASVLSTWQERESAGAVTAASSTSWTSNVPVVFTLVDGSYLDMLDEMWDMVHEKGDMGRRFVFVSLDDATTEGACAAGYPVIYASGSLREETTKQRVYRAKYGIAVSLIDAHEDFLFLEMDVWPRRDLLPIFAPKGSKADMTLMIHQDNPFVVNIGIYFVRANRRTRKLFDTLEKYLVKYTSAFDQDLFNCIIKPHSVVRFFLSRINCEYDGIKTNDPMLVELNDMLNGTATFDVVEPNVAISHDTPVVMADTAVVHILTNRPLTSSHGKKTIAKELYLWHGAHCYYCVGGGGRDLSQPGNKIHWRRPRGRYLTYAGTLGSIRPPTWHSAEFILGVLLNLVGLAVLTDRVLVLPPVYFHEKVFAAWEWFDVLDIRKVVQWREATFFSNPKLRYTPPPEDPGRTDPTVALLHFGMEEILFGNVTAATGEEVSSVQRWPNPVPEEHGSRDQVRRWKKNLWAAAVSEESGALDADVLAVDFTTGQDIHEEVCFFRKKASCQMGTADRTLGQLYSTMKFCDFQDGYISKRQTKGWLAHMDCRTRTDMWRSVRERQRNKQKDNKPKSLKKDPLPVQPTWGEDRAAGR